MDPNAVISSQLTSERAKLAEDEAICVRADAMKSEALARIAVTKPRVDLLEELLKKLGGGADHAAIKPNGASGPASYGFFGDVAARRDSRRGPKGAWRDIMPEMVRQYPTQIFRSQDVEAAGDLHGHEIKPATARSQMSNYVTAGYLERPSLGCFRFTDEGRAIFSELLNKPSPLRLVTPSLPTDGAQVDGGTGEQAPPMASVAKAGITSR
jgi:hypothetical protein